MCIDSITSFGFVETSVRAPQQVVDIRHARLVSRACSLRNYHAAPMPGGLARVSCGWVVPIRMEAVTAMVDVLTPEGVCRRRETMAEKVVQ